MKSSSASTSIPTPVRNARVISTLAPTTGDPGAGQLQANTYVRAGGAQATTTYGNLDSTAQVMLNWGKRLTDLYAQPHGPTFDQARAALTALHKDPAVPPKIRDDALTELTVMLDETDMPFFKAFVDQVRHSASAFCASASTRIQPSANPRPIATAPQAVTAQSVQTVQNITLHAHPLTQAQALAGQPGAAGATAQPYLPTTPDIETPIGPMQKGPMSYEEALLRNPRERPPLNKLGPKTGEMVQYLLQHPEKSSVGAAVAKSGAEGASERAHVAAKSLIKVAREQIAFGTSPAIRKEMFDLLSDYLASDRGITFARFASPYMCSVSMNPRIYSILQAVAEPLMSNGELPKELTLDDLAPHVKNEADKRLLTAFFKDDEYATAGVVSPLAQDPATTEAEPVTVQPQALPQQPMTYTNVQQPSVASILPSAGNTFQSAESSQDLPTAKRQRTGNEFMQEPSQLPLQPAMPEQLQVQQVQQAQQVQQPAQTVDVVQTAPAVEPPVATLQTPLPTPPIAQP